MKRNTPEINSTSDVYEMKRGIKGWQLSFIGLGGVVGSCFFLGMGIVIHDMGPAVFLAFAAAGFVVYGLMIAYAELLVNIPRKGSFIAYTNEFLGETVSTGIGWAFWFNWVCYVPSEAIAVSTILNAMIKNSSPVSFVAIAAGALLALTIINLCAVDIFAKVESTLAITKVCVIILFIILAFGIWTGLWGSSGFLGLSVNFGNGKSFSADLFPNGVAIIFTSMLFVMVNFHGTEIVGLTVGEAQDPETSIPKACRSVTYRIVSLYVISILFVLLIYPYSLADDNNAVFSDIMNYYGMKPFALIMSAIVLVAAFSCANTGIYGTARAMYGLSIEGLAPDFLRRLNKDGNPRNSVLFTIAFMWLVLVIGLYSDISGRLSDVYGDLLSMSAFTGTLAWVGIIMSWILFRRKYLARGYAVTKLKARVKERQRWMPPLSMAMQLLFMLMLAFRSGQLPVFIVACFAIFGPMIVSVALKHTGHKKNVYTLSHGEKSFDELYPDKVTVNSPARKSDETE